MYSKMDFAKSRFLFFFLGSLLLASADNLSDGSFSDDVKRSHFPDGFLFGTASSSYQVEGAIREDGRGISNWDNFTHLPYGEFIEDGSNGDITCDHYHHVLEDIEMMHSLGVNSYRFSISWTRILPRGSFGDVNFQGIRFYNKIIDNLLLRGIQPFVTIFHQEFPQELEDRFGSWLSPLMQHELVYYADICFRHFGDRVRYWTTINEPNLFSKFAYITGKYPPAHCSLPFGNCSTGNSGLEPLTAMHNMLVAHGKVAKLYRDRYLPTQGGLVGIVLDMPMYEPLTDAECDIQAANRAWEFYIGWGLDPLVFGDYPSEMRQTLGKRLPSFSPEEKAYVKGSIDFVGANHYTTWYVKDCIYSTCPPDANQTITGFTALTAYRDGVPIGEPTAMAPFYVVPRGMDEVINYLKKRYNNIPMFVTENGYAPKGGKNEDVHDILNDVKRVQFHKSYLASLAQAIRDGANVGGYFVWSLMDSFEWIHGYGVRFGLHYVDYDTLRRTPKLSAKWYTQFLTGDSDSSRGKNIEMVSQRAKLSQ